MSAHNPNRTQRGRPRDANAHQRILDAAFELVHATSYAEVTIKAIAERAEVGRQTIYRRWPTKERLFMEVVTMQVQQAALATNGNDLEAYLQHLFELARTRTGVLLTALLMQASDDPALTLDIQELINQRRTMLERVVVEDARRCGYTYAVPAATIAELLAAVMWYRLIYKHKPLDDAFAHELAGTVRALTNERKPYGH